VAAPTLTSQTGSTWTDIVVPPEATGTLTWNSGDRILVIGFTEDQTITLATPTATGLTFAPLGTAMTTPSSCWAHAWTATAGSSGSSAVSAAAGTGTGTADRGLHAFAFGNCTGFVRTDGAAVNSTQTVSVTRTQANSFMVALLADWSASGTTGLGWTPAGQTQVQSATTADATAFAAYWGDQGSTGTTSYGATGLPGTAFSKFAVEVLGSASAASVPWATRPQPRTADPGESYWTQARRLDQGPLAAANPLAVPLLAPTDVAQRAATHARPAWARQAPQLANQGAAAGVAYDPTLAPPGRTLAAYADRREYPAQRSYPAPPDPVSLVGTGQLNAWWSDDSEPYFIAATMPRYADPSLLAPPPPAYDPTTAPPAATRLAPATHAPRPQPPAQRRAPAAVDAAADAIGTGAVGGWWSVDDWAHFGPAQRRPLADQSSAPAGTPFDPTQTGYGWVAELVAATHRDRRLVPQQRTALAMPDDMVVVGTGAMVAWWGVDDTAAFLGQRRGFDLPQQAPAVPFDPTLAAWLPLWLAWNRAATHGDRRLVPQQRPYISDPSTYPAPPPATDPLLGAGAVGGDTWRRINLPAFADRREVPQQRIAVLPLAPPLPDADPLLLPDDARRRYLSPAYYDRREVPQQPQREWLYFDAGPGVPPLTLAWGAGGAYWHLYNRPSRPRPFWPLPPQFAVMGECDCTTARPFAGTTTRPSSGATGRPSSGITVRPCTC
jgi:hypothetical protein